MRLTKKFGYFTAWLALILGLTLASVASLVGAFYVIGKSILVTPLLLGLMAICFGALTWFALGGFGGRVS